MTSSILPMPEAGEDGAPVNSAPPAGLAGQPQGDGADAGGERRLGEAHRPETRAHRSGGGAVGRLRAVAANYPDEDYPEHDGRTPADRLRAPSLGGRKAQELADVHQ